MRPYRPFSEPPKQVAGYSTAAVARMFDKSPVTLLVAHSRAGHWCGIVPRKLPNRMLLWPVSEVERVLRGEQPTSEYVIK